MTAVQAYGRLTTLVARDDADVHVVLASRDPEADNLAYIHQKVDMGVHVANHFRAAARAAVASRTATVAPINFQPGDRPSTSGLIYLAPNEVPGVNAAIAAMEPLANQANFTGETAFLKRLRYYVVRVSHGEQVAYFFHRANRNMELAKKGLVVQLSGHRFNRVEERMFSFNEDIDFMVFEGYIFLNTFDPFLKLFADDIKVAFAEQAAPVFTALRDAIDMENFDEFEAVCRDDARLSGALIRIQQRGGLNGLTTDWILEKNALLTQHQLDVQTRADGTRSIRFQAIPTHRFILLKILEEKVNRGERSGITWIAGSHVQG